LLKLFVNHVAGSYGIHLHVYRLRLHQAVYCGKGDFSSCYHSLRRWQLVLPFGFMIGCHDAV
jgi:hypothetical protein